MPTAHELVGCGLDGLDALVVHVDGVLEAEREKPVAAELDSPCSHIGALPACPDLVLLVLAELLLDAGVV